MKKMDDFVRGYFAEVSAIADTIDYEKLSKLIDRLAKLRERGGRLFVVGAGGSAGNASHAVNDFRKLCGIEAYTPSDNVSELTARVNDDGWEHSYSGWLAASRFNENDALFVFSVGGGDIDLGISVSLINAVELAKRRKSAVFSIVGRSNSYCDANADISIVVPEKVPARRTPHSEEFQAVIWHCLVSSPKLQIQATKW